MSVPQMVRLRPRGAKMLYDAAGRREARAARSSTPHADLRPDIEPLAMVTNRLTPRPGDLIGRRIGGYTIEALLG